MDYCPRGYICFTHINVITSIIILLLVLYIINKEYYIKLYLKLNEKKEQEEEDTQEEEIIQEKQYVDTNKIRLENTLTPPLMRNYHTETSGIVEIPKPKGIPINIETRGSGGDYQQVGVLYRNNVNAENTDTNILPLFGRPTYRGSQHWNYYTASDKYHQIKIPLNIGNTDCTDDRGCSELNTGDIINIPEYNGDFKVNIYKLDKIRYIPYVY